MAVAQSAFDAIYQRSRNAEIRGYLGTASRVREDRANIRIRETGSGFALVAGAALSLIGILLGARRPPTITRRVIAVVVDSIQRQIWRAIAHVGQKILKIVPAFTHTNASPGILWMVKNSVSGVAPGFISPGYAVFSVSMAVTAKVFDAPAGTSFPTFKIGTSDKAFSTAVAGTKPRRLSTYRSAPTIDYERSASQSDQIDSFIPHQSSPIVVLRRLMATIKKVKPWA